jgi:hypothetical protein
VSSHDAVTVFGGPAEDVIDQREDLGEARDHGHDFNEMRNAADRLDHYAHMLRRLHDNELGQTWRHESLADRS